MDSKSTGFILLLLTLFLVEDGIALRLKGGVETDTPLAYVGKFVFNPRAEGRLDYEVKLPAGDCCSELVVFNGGPEKWSLVMEKGQQKGCVDEWEPIPDMQHTRMPLRTDAKICENITENGLEFKSCKGSRHFEYPQQQWHYLMIMNCHGSTTSGIDASYKVHFVNARNRITAEFSADENANLIATGVCAILMTMIFCIANIYGMQLAQKKMFHKTYQLWILALVVHVVGMVTMSCTWLIFALDGFERPRFELVGQGLMTVGTVIFASLLVLVSEGYTITRSQLRSSLKLKVTTFAVVFSVAYAALYYLQETADPQQVRNIYDTPFASGVAGIRIIGALWCLCAMYSIVNDSPVKEGFYRLFAVLVVLWFIGEPVVILLSNFVLPLYCRSKYILAVNLGVTLLGHVAFLVLTRPSISNHDFPFHLFTHKLDFTYFWNLNPANNYEPYKPSDITFDAFLKSQSEQWKKEAGDNAPVKTDQSRSISNVILDGAKNAMDVGDRQINTTSISGTMPVTNLDHHQEAMSKLQIQLVGNNDKIIDADKHLGLIDLQNSDLKPSAVGRTNNNGKAADNADTLKTMAKQNTVKYEEETPPTRPPKPTFYRPADVMKRTLADNIFKHVPSLHKDGPAEDTLKCEKEMPPTPPPKPTFYKPANVMRRTLADNTFKKAPSCKKDETTPKKECVIDMKPADAPLNLLSKITNMMSGDKPNSAVVLPVTKFDVTLPNISGRDKCRQSKEVMAIGNAVESVKKFADMSSNFPGGEYFRRLNDLSPIQSPEAKPAVIKYKTSNPFAESDEDVPSQVGLAKAAAWPKMVKFDDLAAVPLDIDGETFKDKNQGTPVAPNAKSYGAASSIKYVAQEMNRRLLSRPTVHYTKEDAVHQNASMPIQSAVVQPPVIKYKTSNPFAESDEDVPSQVGLAKAAAWPTTIKFDDLAEIPLHTDGDTFKDKNELKGTPVTPKAKNYVAASSIKYVAQEMNRRMLSRPTVQYTKRDSVHQNASRHIPEKTEIQRRSRNNCMTKAQRQLRISDMNDCMEQVKRDEIVLEIETATTNPAWMEEGAAVHIKRKKRNPLHKAQKMMGMKKKKSVE